MIEEVGGDVRGGVEFSAALEKHPKVFNTLFVSLMRASEASGTMGKMLQRVSEYMEQQRETRKRIKGAMTYPMCMLFFCVIVVVCLLVFILPRFEKIYAGKDAVLPVPTRVLVAMSHAITDYWPLIIGGLVTGVVALAFYLRSSGGRRMLDTVRIRVPVLGKLCRKACLARSLRCMATMVSTGVSMLDGLDITAKVAGNRHYDDIWNRVADGVKEGATVSEQLCDCPLIPPSVAQMIDAGERSGKLGMVMDRVAKFCEDDLKVAVKTMTDLIEPVMIIVMGIIVGGIAMALLLPVFKISKVVGR
jgi:type IV pilus assembly protein PilC